MSIMSYFTKPVREDYQNGYSKEGFECIEERL